MLTGISVRSFRILQDVSLGIVQNDLENFLKQESAADCAAGFCPPLRSLAVLVGDNRSGKSSLLEALAFLRDAVLYGSEQASAMEQREGLDEIHTYGQPEELRIELCLLTSDRRAILSYGASFGKNSAGQATFTSEELIRYRLSHLLAEVLDLDVPEVETLAETMDKMAVFSRKELSQSGECPDLLETEAVLAAHSFRESHEDAEQFYNFLEHIFILTGDGKGDRSDRHTHRRRRSCPQAATEEPLLLCDGENVDSWLRYWQAKDETYYNELSALIGEVLHIPWQGRLLDWISRLTASESKLCLVLLLLHQKQAKTLLSFENPDSGLYPDKVDALAAELRAYTLTNPDSQIFMTTSHMNLLESMAPEEVWAFHLNGSEARSVELDRDLPLRAGVLPRIRVRSAVEDPLIVAMYREGIGLGTLLYGGYFA